MTEIWLLWIVLTVSAGHLAHIPVHVDEADEFPSQAACEETIPELQQTLTTAFPDDSAIKLYCEQYIVKPEPPVRQEKRYPNTAPDPEVSFRMPIEDGDQTPPYPRFPTDWRIV